MSVNVDTHMIGNRLLNQIVAIFLLMAKHGAHTQIVEKIKEIGKFFVIS